MPDSPHATAFWRAVTPCLGNISSRKSFCVMLTPKEAVEADCIFKALAEGGTVQIPIAEAFWALRFGKLVDRFGVPWLVNCEKPAVENVA